MKHKILILILLVFLSIGSLYYQNYRNEERFNKKINEDRVLLDAYLRDTMENTDFPRVRRKMENIKVLKAEYFSGRISAIKIVENGKQKTISLGPKLNVINIKACL